MKDKHKLTKRIVQVVSRHQVTINGRGRLHNRLGCDCELLVIDAKLIFLVDWLDDKANIEGRVLRLKEAIGLTDCVNFWAGWW